MNLWDKIRNNRDLPAVNAILNISKSAAAALLVLAPGFVAWLLGTSWLTTALVAVFAGVVLIASGWFLRRAIDWWRLRAQRTDWNPNLWVRRRWQLCHVIDDKTHVFYYRISVEVLEDRVDGFVLSLEWTGAGKLEIELENEGFGYVDIKSDPSIRRIIKIMFDRPKRKGEVVDLRYKVTTHGNIKEQENFFSHTFTDSKFPAKATLVVSFAAPVLVQRVWKEEYYPAVDHIPIRPAAEFELDASRAVSWEFDVEHGHRYAIRWTVL